MIQRADGRDPHPVLPLPLRRARLPTLRIVNRLGYTSVRWTVDTLGWMGPPREQSVAGATRRVLRRDLVPGEIVLMHLGSSRDGSTIDSHALPGVIRAVRARDYRFVTLAGLRWPPRSVDRPGSALGRRP